MSIPGFSAGCTATSSLPGQFSSPLASERVDPGASQYWVLVKTAVTGG